MNRSRIAQLAALIATVTVGAATYSIYTPKPTTEHDDLVDAGAVPANRVATCPVRVSEECAAQFGVKPYETLRFPVVRDVLPDGGVAILLPAASRAAGERLRDCVRVTDWASCDLDPVSTFPAIAAKRGDANPFTRVRAAARHVIPDCSVDGGWDTNHAPVDCLRNGEWRGCNVFPRSEATGTQCLVAPSNVVEAGDSIEDSLVLP